MMFASKVSIIVDVTMLVIAAECTWSTGADATEHRCVIAAPLPANGMGRQRVVHSETISGPCRYGYLAAARQLQSWRVWRRWAPQQANAWAPRARPLRLRQPRKLRQRQCPFKSCRPFQAAASSWTSTAGQSDHGRERHRSWPEKGEPCRLLREI